MPDSFQATLSNLALTTVAVGALLLGILVLLALFFAPNQKSKPPIFTAIITVIVIVTVTVTGCAVFTNGISATASQKVRHD